MSHGPEWTGSKRLPNLLSVSLSSVQPSVPRRTKRSHSRVTSSPILPFTLFAQAQHPEFNHPGSKADRVTRLQSSRNARPGRIACPSPARTVRIPGCLQSFQEASTQIQSMQSSATLAGATFISLGKLNRSHHLSNSRCRPLKALRLFQGPVHSRLCPAQRQTSVW